MRIELGDGFRTAAWQTDPGVLEVGKRVVVDFICDCSAGLVMTVVDGVFCDGGEVRAQGWGRLPGDLGEPKGSYQAWVDPQVSTLRLYNRPIRTSEAVGNFRAAQGAAE